MTENIKCRKCGGAHFTIKCNQNKLNIDNNKLNIDNNNKLNIDNKINNNNINKFNNDNKINNNNKFNNINKFNNDNNKFNNNNNKYYKYNKYEGITYRIKISEMPNDITEQELMDQLYNWGDIIKIKIINNYETSNIYIDFKYEDQADYFIKGLNKTTFDHRIIIVSKL